MGTNYDSLRKQYSPDNQPAQQTEESSIERERIKRLRGSRFLQSVLMRSPEALSTKPLYLEGRGWWPLPPERKKALEAVATG